MKTRIVLELDVDRKLTNVERIFIRQFAADQLNSNFDFNLLRDYEGGKSVVGYFIGPEEDYP